MNHSFLCRTRKKKSRGGQSTNSRGVIRCFLLLAASFRCSEPVFHPRLSVENRLDPLYM